MTKTKPDKLNDIKNFHAATASLIKILKIHRKGENICKS